MEYPKINSLWKRRGFYPDKRDTGTPGEIMEKKSLIVGDYAEPEFGAIKKWRVYEKIDGTNVRIYFTNMVLGDKPNPRVHFYGRTNAAQMPCHLFAYLQEHFTVERLSRVFKDEGVHLLFGEGYGPKIQAGGGNYRKNPGFILFDVCVGNWWLKHEDVKMIADQLLIPMVPLVGVLSEEKAVEFVKMRPSSLASEVPQVMEGIVARSEPLMLFRNGNPIMWKLKTKDFYDHIPVPPPQ